MENFGTLYIVQNTPGIAEGARNGIGMPLQELGLHYLDWLDVWVLS